MPAQPMSGFYACPNLAGRRIAVVLLSEQKWTSFLKMHGGIPSKPFYARPSRPSEPATHPNGHPWAWLYTPEEALKDEARWLPADEYARFEQALKRAVADLDVFLREQQANDRLVKEPDSTKQVAV